MLIVTHSSKHNLDAPTKTVRITYHSNTITTPEHDREVAFKVALPPTTTQLDGDLYVLADAMQFLSTSAPNLTNLDRVIITTHEPRALDLITDTGTHNRVELHWTPRKPSVHRFPLFSKIFTNLHRGVDNLQVDAPLHSLPYTHSLDYITITHELERLRSWQLFFNNSHVSRLVHATIPTVSLKLHPFWLTLRLAWKHQDDPDRELSLA
ncbi:hypothetical protein H0H81_004105 [Sphagnurus paluster]|uniref:Uncharacterized protein n=1 Tax=Sphagnurus paluster TaxID=117069 RepID=A0A9P7GG96_9AGAR|nr:hypothetical protein H0H81_004105 [Sphagnurus paluster]